MANFMFRITLPPRPWPFSWGPWGTSEETICREMDAGKIEICQRVCHKLLVFWKFLTEQVAQLGNCCDTGLRDEPAMPFSIVQCQFFLRIVH